MTGHEFRAYVDKFLEEWKDPIGVDKAPDWKPGRDYGCQRLKFPLEVAGEQRGEALIIDAYPDVSPVRYYFILEVGGCPICHLDFEPASGSHPNPLDAADKELPLMVSGPHAHLWKHNRELFKDVSRPPKLRYRMQLPPHRQFDALLRWFCEEHKIRLGRHEIDLPQSLRLL